MNSIKAASFCQGIEKGISFRRQEMAIPGEGPAEGLKTIMEQVFEGSHTREHMVGIGLIPLSSLVTEGTLVLGWGWELPRISHALLE